MTAPYEIRVLPLFSSWIASAQASLTSRTRPGRGSERGQAQHPLKRAEIFSRQQPEHGAKTGARRGLALHELGLILVIIACLADILGVLCTPSSQRGAIGHAIQESAWLADPASQPPVK